MGVSGLAAWLGGALKLWRPLERQCWFKRQRTPPRRVSCARREGSHLGVKELLLHVFQVLAHDCHAGLVFLELIGGGLELDLLLRRRFQRPYEVGEWDLGLAFWVCGLRYKPEVSGLGCRM